jgi:hypothetical protein
MEKMVHLMWNKWLTSVDPKEVIRKSSTLPNKKDALLIFVIGGFVKQSVFTYLRLKM